MRSPPDPITVDPRLLVGLGGPRELEVPAERVRHPHLLRSAALRLEQLRVADEDADASRPRRRDVESMPAEQELHTVRGLLWARRRHRVDDDGRLLPLELVYGSDASPGDALGDLGDLRVVRCDDQDFIERHGLRLTMTVRPGDARRDEAPHDLPDALGFLG